MAIPVDVATASKGGAGPAGSPGAALLTDVVVGVPVVVGVRCCFVEERLDVLKIDKDVLIMMTSCHVILLMFSRIT